MQQSSSTAVNVAPTKAVVDPLSCPVEKKLGQKFKWQPLRKWCRDNDAEPHEVEDPRFGTVKSWPRAAWIAVYGVDLRKLF